MSWIAVAVGGGAALSFIGNQLASDSAADAQRSAANAANATQLAMFNQTRKDQTPWRDAGKQALGQMQDQQYQQDFTMNDFKTDPGYNFRLQEGMKALERSAAARGSLNSGATLKAIARYGQNVATDEYQNAYNRYNADKDRRFNRLASLAGIGQTATNAMSNANQAYGNNVSANQMAVGNANAAQHMATANNLNNLASTGLNTWMNYQMINKFAPGGK